MNTVNGQVTDEAAVVLTDAMRGYHHEDDTVEPDAVKYAELLRDSGLLRQDVPRPVDGEHAVCNACGWDGSPTRITCPDCGSADVNYFTPGSAALPPTASLERVAEVLNGAIEDHVPGEEFVTPHAKAVDLSTYLVLRLAAAGVFTEARPEAEVKAEALSEAADESGVNIGPDDGEWWKGYRQAQREIIVRLTERAAALRAGGQS